MGVDVSNDTKHANPQVISYGNGKDVQDLPISHYAVYVMS